MKDIHPPKPEHGHKRDTSPLDDVHTAPYAAYAERILSEGALGGEQKYSPLSVVLQKSEENEPGSEAAAQAELDRFKSEIEEIKKQFIGNPNKTLEINCDDFEVVYDPETSEYCVAPSSGVDVIITITNYTGEFNGLTPLHIPTSLRLSLLNITNYPLASIPDRVAVYDVSGMNYVEVLMPKMSRGVHIYDTFIKKLPPLPEMPESPNSLELVGNHLLDELPELPENLFGLYTANNGSANILRQYSVDMLPASLRIFVVGDKESYSWSEKRKMKKRGINFRVVKQ